MILTNVDYFISVNQRVLNPDDTLESTLNVKHTNAQTLTSHIVISGAGGGGARHPYFPKFTQVILKVF